MTIQKIEQAFSAHQELLEEFQKLAEWDQLRIADELTENSSDDAIELLEGITE